MQRSDFKFPGDFVTLSSNKETMEAWLVLDLMRNSVQQLIIAFELYDTAFNNYAERKESIKKDLCTTNYDSENPFGFLASEVDLHSHSILYAVDRYIKLLERLKKYDDIKAIAIKYYNKIKHHFPDVHGVRDSSQHIIERVQGLGKNGSEIPLDKDAILKISVNEPNVLIYTTSQGREGRLNITEQKIKYVSNHFKSLLNELPWIKLPVF
jgi:hypothetical protein